MTIDLRSDTITKPTKAMKEFMFQAEVGDDVFGEDPSINALEQKAAALFGKECGLFCPSGTMTNQIGINILSNPYEEVICYEGSHIYKYEGGGVAGNSALSFKLLKGDRGRIKSEDVEACINPDDQHFPDSAIVSLENTVNKGGGSCYTLEEIDKIKQVADRHNLRMHLDGARIFNALMATGDRPEEYGKYFDTLSICLSKGLGAPVGSILLYDKPLDRKARRRRKTFGGAMRQAGYLAAAGIYALDNHVDRLADDHARARILGDVLERQEYISEVLPVDTNIVIFGLANGIKAEKGLSVLEQNGIHAVGFGPHEIRFVTHLDFNDDHLTEAVGVLKRLGVGDFEG